MAHISSTLAPSVQAPSDTQAPSAPGPSTPAPSGTSAADELTAARQMFEYYQNMPIAEVKRNLHELLREFEGKTLHGIDIKTRGTIFYSENPQHTHIVHLLNRYREENPKAFNFR
jgi:hypothetical protein